MPTAGRRTEMKVSEDLRESIKHAPDLPGVYLFRDQAGLVLYAGKALSLRKRLASYLLPAEEGGGRTPSKVREMVGRAAAVEWIVTGSETEALLLEHNLIKEHRPPFNIRLRDDKSYPYIVITLGDEFPRVMFTRQPHKRGDLYFGPYANAAKVRETLDALRRVFPLRACRGREPGRPSGSPCLQFHIGRCRAPCAGLVGRTEYRALVDQVIDFLSGRETKLVAELEEAMTAAARAQQFEAAALYRDRLAALRHVLERQQVESGVLGSADVTGMAIDEWGANVQVFLTRDGRVVDRKSFTLVNVEGATPDEVFRRFVAEYYAVCPSVPAELVVPSQVRERAALAGFLESLRGAKVSVRAAARGDKRRLQRLADHNAVLALAQARLSEERSRERRLTALESLATALDLPGLPLRIEGYDISNLGGENIVASMVVFEGGSPKKSDYRKFAIKTTAGQDDYAALREVIVRRFSPDREASYDPSFEAVPDLVLIDGGKGQLAAAREGLRAVGLEGAFGVVALAKREEEVFVPWAAQPVGLARDDPGLLLLQRVRDEAHRFALGYHRTKRAAQVTASLLDQLPGIGEKRRKAIVQHFGSPERVLQATREELEAVPGLPGKVAREVYAYIHKTG
jgi:excinuclease ABC subunit C